MARAPGAIPSEMGPTHCRATPEEEEFITSGNWRGKHNSLSRGAFTDQP